MATQCPTPGAAGVNAAHGANTQTESKRDVFNTRLAAFRISKAQLVLHCAQAPTGFDRDHERENEHLSGLNSAAMDQLLLTPCADQRDLWEKIDIIVSEEIHDGWHLADEIMALLRCDARKLLDLRRPRKEA